MVKLLSIGQLKDIISNLNIIINPIKLNIYIIAK